jgi:hypothetical protein
MSNFNRAQIILGSRRGGYVLAYQGYIFQKNQMTTDKIYWRCAQALCSVSIHTNIFPIQLNASPTIVKEPSNHSHQPCHAVIARQLLVSSMADVVRADPCSRVRAAYDNVIAAGSSIPDDHIPTFSSVASILNRRRASCFPPIPATINDVDIRDEWQRTWRDKTFMQHLDNAWGIVIFATDKNLRILARCDTIFLDGTFRSAPHPYIQMLTIHGFFMGSVIPLCFCLVTGKTTAQYRQILQYVQVKVRRASGRRWQPTTAVCDFELSLITAIETELLGIRVRGCYFHFGQSLWRKFSSLGLVSAFNRDDSRGSRLRKCVQKLLAIGFLPVLLVRQAFLTYLNSRQVGFFRSIVTFSFCLLDFFHEVGMFSHKVGSQSHIFYGCHIEHQSI